MSPSQTTSRHAFALVTLVALIGCGDPTPDASAPAEGGKQSETPTALVTRKDFPVEVGLPASVVGDEHAKLMAKIEGYVDTLHVNIGEAVKKDKLLATIRAPELEAEVLRKTALLAKAESEVEQVAARRTELAGLRRLRETQLTRVSNLRQAGALKQANQDEARFALAAITASLQKNMADKAAADAQVDVAKADLAVSEALASYREIRAPFDGVITRRMVDPGALVRPATAGTGATPLLEIDKLDKVRVVAFVPIRDAAQLTKDDAARFHGIHGLPGFTIPGVVARVSKAFDEKSRMMRVEVDLDNRIEGKEKNFAVALESGMQNKTWRLWPGDYGSLTVTVRTHKNLLAVPKDSVATRSGSDYVVVVDSDNHAQHRHIMIKARYQFDIDGKRKEFVGIETGAGIKKGDRIVTKEPASVADGATVKAAK